MYSLKSVIFTLFSTILNSQFTFAQNKNTEIPDDGTSAFQIILFIIITCLILGLIIYVLNKRQKRKFNE